MNFYCGNLVIVVTRGGGIVTYICRRKKRIQKGKSWKNASGSEIDFEEVVVWTKDKESWEALCFLFGLFNIIWNLYFQSNLVIVMFNKYSHTLLWLWYVLLIIGILQRLIFRGLLSKTISYAPFIKLRWNLCTRWYLSSFH
jgi:hypothetical protein